MDKCMTMNFSVMSAWTCKKSLRKSFADTTLLKSDVNIHTVYTFKKMFLTMLHADGFGMWRLP